MFMPKHNTVSLHVIKSVSVHDTIIFISYTRNYSEVLYDHYTISSYKVMVLKTHEFGIHDTI